MHFPFNKPAAGATDTYRFIRACFGVPTPHDLEQLREQVRSPKCEWVEIVRDAATGKVLPALYGRLKALGINDVLPDAMVEFFENLDELSRERNEAILQELAEIAGLLNTAGVEPVVLKGAAYLIRGVYQNISERYLLDLDLLAPDTSLPGAAEFLKGNGYEVPAPVLKNKHHYPEMRRGATVGVELHWQLGARRSAQLLPSKEVLERSSRLRFRGTWIRIPSVEHLVVHHISHSQIQDGLDNQLWPSFRTMQDFRALNDCGHIINWPEIEAMFRRRGEFGVLASHLLMMEELIGIQPPIRIRYAGFGRLSYLRLKLLRKMPMLKSVDPAHVLYSQIVPGVRALQKSYGWRSSDGDERTKDRYRSGA